MPMHSRASGLHAVLLAAVSVVTLTGCPTAAPTPCLIQRPPLQGYTIKFILQSTPAAGCEAVLPPIFADNWRFDGFSDSEIWVKSDSIPYPDGDEGGPQSTVLGHGTFTETPDSDNICTIAEMTASGGEAPDLPDFGTISYHPSGLRFLDGARYQGSTFEGNVDITFGGTCTGTYTMQGLTPSPIGLIGPCVDDSLCDPFGDPANGILASGINPDYAVSCVKEDWVTTFLTGDPALGICFFTKP